MIKVEKVNKYFNRFRKNQIHAINNTSLQMGKTGLVAILGPSGCGKTTLLNAIGGLDKTNGGKIYINGKRINGIFPGKTDEIRTLNIGYIFQKFLLINDMTVYENVAIVLKMIGVKNKQEIRKRVEYVLEKVGMEQYKNRLPTMLSGGQRQRVAIARAIVKNPNIIIADEPTGNLDSKNSLEIMKIIKSISEDKLVVLVTHEKDLAKFFATRIIEVVDGKITSDYENLHNEELDYKLEQNVYLKDIEQNENVKVGSVGLNIYNDSPERNTDITVVVKNGNIYIKSNSGAKVEVVDDNSSIEFLDEHYKKLSKEKQEENKFDLNKIAVTNKKLRYKSIHNVITSTLHGFKKVFKYPFMKKLLLIGFFIAALLVTFSVYSAAALLESKDSMFITQTKGNINVTTQNMSVAKYNKYKKLDFVKYIMPSDSIVRLKLKMDKYYQTKNRTFNISGSLTSKELLKKEDIILGKMPENNKEIVLDKMIIEKLINRENMKQLNLGNVEDYLNKETSVGYVEGLKIVGIVDKVEPSIYVDENMFLELTMNDNTSSPEYEKMAYDDYAETKQMMSSNIVCIDYFKDKISLVEGKKPSKENETIINVLDKEEYKLGSEIEDVATDKKLKVVGYYKSIECKNQFFVTKNTTINIFINESNKITIYPKDKQKAIKYFEDSKLQVEDIYAKDKKAYEERVENEVKTAAKTTIIMLVISLLEIYLILRSSFLSRIKEIGVYRAIGVKKSDIKKMFKGEIFAITMLASIPAFMIMTYIAYNLDKMPMVGDTIKVSIPSAVIALAIIVVANTVAGLLPLFKILRKKPAEILSRTDID